MCSISKGFPRWHNSLSLAAVVLYIIMSTCPRTHTLTAQQYYCLFLFGPFPFYNSFLISCTPFALAICLWNILIIYFHFFIVGFWDEHGMFLIGGNRFDDHLSLSCPSSYGLSLLVTHSWAATSLAEGRRLGSGSRSRSMSCLTASLQPAAHSL